MTSVPGAMTLEQAATRFSQAVEDRENAAVREMLVAYSQVERAVMADLDRLLALIADAQARNAPPSLSWLYRQERSMNLLAAIQVEVARFTGVAQTATMALQSDVAATAANTSLSLVNAALADSLSVSFVAASPATLGITLGYLADGSPLAALLGTFPAETAQAIHAALVQGVIRGKHPTWIAREARKALGISRQRAERIARTEAMRVHREVARRTYEANADVLEGWTWRAAQDRRTCVACWVMDGTLHDVTETLDGHPMCRCAMVPRTLSWEALGVEGVADSRPPVRDGRQAFLDAPDSVKRYLLGPAKFRALQDGTITVDDLVARPSDPRWGTMRRERSLREIREGRNANTPDQRPASQEQPAARPAERTGYSSVKSRSAEQLTSGRGLPHDGPMTFTTTARGGYETRHTLSTGRSIVVHIYKDTRPNPSARGGAFRDVWVAEQATDTITGATREEAAKALIRLKEAKIAARTR